LVPLAVLLHKNNRISRGNSGKNLKLNTDNLLIIAAMIAGQNSSFLTALNRVEYLPANSFSVEDEKFALYPGLPANT
jgi:hypothetical protein